MPQDILVETIDEGGRVLRITFNRPDRKNAYTQRLCDEVCAALAEFERHKEQRVVVLTGAGDAFCSGGDVQSPEETERGDSHPFGHGDVMRDTGHAVVRALTGLSKPSIAAINGSAVAGGLTFALACDLRIATASARLGDTAIRFGLLPDEGGAWFFPRAMGLESALRMSLLGEVYTAEQALTLGLVGEVVPDGDFDEAVVSLADRLASTAPLAASATKRLMRQSVDSSLDQTFEAIRSAVNVVNRSEDVTEGVAAFLARRPAVFEGR